MEPIEESTTLSPKESIVNILGRLFNNGHISGDELAMMQMELVARNPEPEPVSVNDVLLEKLLLRMREADANHKRDPQRLGTWHVHKDEHDPFNPFKIPTSDAVRVSTSEGSRSDTMMSQALLNRYLKGTEYGMFGYIDANKLTDIFKDAKDI